MYQQQRLSSAALFFFCLLCALTRIFQSTSAFTSIVSSNHQTKLYMSSFFADATPPKETTAAVQTDANGNAITLGQKVAIVSHNSIKAYHVPKSSYGSFDATTKQFRPQDEANITRKTSCLLLPEGLQGEVITVHDSNARDRPQPILVKFRSDEERSDGYTLNDAFTMHLGANEIMVVA